MINAIRFARERKVPYFGICLGMQTLVIEYARNVCGLADADSTEFNPGTPHRVIFKLRELKGVDELGGTMRLGGWPCRLVEDSFACRAYGTREIRSATAIATNSTANTRSAEGRRAAHYGRNAGQTYVEICEMADHPWYLGCQFHPEFKSKPMDPHPLFKAFIGAAYEYRHAALAARRRSRAIQPCRLITARSAAGQPLVLIAGPCVIESEEHVHRMARGIREAVGEFVFKASFDKANRTSGGAYRGPGMQEGLRILAGVKAEGFPILTDIHEPCAGRAGRRGGGHSADPRVPLPPDRPAAGRRAHRAHRQHQEGAVRGAARYPPRRGEGGLHREPPGGADRARLVVRLQQPGGGHARPEDHARRRLAGGFRRHA